MCLSVSWPYVGALVVILLYKNHNLVTIVFVGLLSYQWLEPMQEFLELVQCTLQ